MSGRFFDSNVVLYLLDPSPKADIAEQGLAEGGMISVQVLNEVLVNCRRKSKLDWSEPREFLTGIRSLCSVVDLTLDVHDVGSAIAERYQLQVYDSMIVAAALLNECDELLSEYMQDDLVIEEVLKIRKPFQG